jgi:tetratricopeptide (TPR) repeat protein
VRTDDRLLRIVRDDNLAAPEAADPEAVRLMEEAVAAESADSPPAWRVSQRVELGRLLQQGGHDERALARFTDALRIEPDCPLALRLEAEALLALHRRDAGCSALDRSLTLTTQPSAEVCRARGLLYAQDRNYRQAIDMDTLALRAAPGDVQARAERGWAYLMLDAGQPALVDFEEWVKAEPKNAEALAARGNARIRLHRMAEALADAEAAEKQGPASPRLLHCLTRLYAQVAGHLEASGRSQDPLAWDWVIVYQGRALDCLRRTLELTPPARRAAFWREEVLNDPLLAPVRKGPVYEQLAFQYGGAA